MDKPLLDPQDQNRNIENGIDLRKIHLGGGDMSGHKINRRAFVATAAASSVAAKTLVAESAEQLGRIESAEETFDYVIVGSGAGGGPLAANLALAGYRVCVLEAGDWDDKTDVYRTPAFHTRASEDQNLSWQYFVRHYNQRPERDPKYQSEKRGCFYPRGGTIGGSTAVNAMITILPHHSDWQDIVNRTGDESWAPENMRRLFQKVENCQYADSRNGNDRHGFGGWLPTSQLPSSTILQDLKLAKIVRAAALECGDSVLEPDLDPNTWAAVKNKTPGIYSPPLATMDGERYGARDVLAQAKERVPQLLTIKTGALAEKVLFEDRRAVGVQFLEGSHVYRADPHAAGDGARGRRKVVKAEREVIVSGGAFNSPQLLKLSGIGPEDELRRHGIPVVQHLPGVGENLQDHYEISVVHEMNSEFSLLSDCTFGQGEDPCRGRSTYESSGSAIGVIRKSNPDLDDPDLFLFGLPGRFRGYYQGYSEAVLTKNYFTWVILQAHAKNRSGRVRLRSSDPRDTPDIEFNYFEEGSDGYDQDLEAMLNGVKFARRVMNRYWSVRTHVRDEVLPGREVRSDAALKEYIGDQTWGHHASCTNKIGGDDDPMAVLDSKFRVRGVEGLRVVDASVFPVIPGYFIAAPTYIVSQKAFEDITQG